MAAASHFARLSYEWGAGIPASEPGYLKSREPAEQMRFPELVTKAPFAQGAVAVACAEIGNYTLAFDADFQRDVAQLQERGGVFRRGGHYFWTHQRRTNTSYVVYGGITNPGYSSSFIGVEVHAYGAVSAYFREYTNAATLDEVVGWWIYGAWSMAMAIHLLLGTTGPAHVALLFDPRVSGYRGPWPVSVLHGPFELWSMKESSYTERRRVAFEPGLEEGRIASLRDDIVRKLIADGAQGLGEQPDWSPEKVRERMAQGRPVEIAATPRKRGLFRKR